MTRSHSAEIDAAGVVDVEPQRLAGGLLERDQLDLRVERRDPLLDRSSVAAASSLTACLAPSYLLLLTPRNREKKGGPGPTSQGSGT